MTPDPAWAPAGGRCERALRFAVAGGFVAVLLLSLASAVLMALGDDEAWLLAGVQGLAERGEFGHDYGPGATTTGGVHTLAELLLYLLAGNSVPVLRLFPLACLVLLVREVFAWSREAGLSKMSALLSGAVLFAVPGTTSLASAAYGAVPAALLVVAGVRRWSGAHQRRWVSAVLLGLAAATRPQCLVIFPALIFASIMGPREERAGLGRRILLGLVVFAAGFGVLLAATPSALEAALIAQDAAGLALWPSLPFVGQTWIGAERLLPFTLLVGATAIRPWLLDRQPDTQQRLLILLWFGWLGWSVWLLLTPISHVRYLWTSLAAFACVLGFGLAQLHEWGLRNERPRIRIAALAMGVACLVTASGAALRDLAVGEQNVITWESRGLIPLGAAGYGHGGDQARMAERLRRHPASEPVAALDYGLEVAFLAGRPVKELRWHLHRWQKYGEPPPRWILATPHLNNRVVLARAGARWLAENCVLEVAYGGYRLFRVVGQYPAKLTDLVTTGRAKDPSLRRNW